MKGPCGDRAVLYLGGINVNILVVTLYIVLQNVTFRENWIKGTVDLSVLILTTSCGFTLS